MSLILLTAEGGPNTVTICDGEIVLDKDAELVEYYHNNYKCTRIKGTSAFQTLVDSVFKQRNEPITNDLDIYFDLMRMPE